MSPKTWRAIHDDAICRHVDAIAALTHERVLAVILLGPDGVELMAPLDHYPALRSIFRMGGLLGDDPPEST